MLTLVFHIAVPVAIEQAFEDSHFDRRSDNRLGLVFVGRHADVRFAVTLTPGPAYPLGSLPCSTKIYFDGDGQVTAADVAAAVARAPAGPGRIRAVCSELSDMVVKLAPKAAGQTGAFLSAFGNPLFGSNMGAPQPVA